MSNAIGVVDSVKFRGTSCKSTLERGLLRACHVRPRYSWNGHVVNCCTPAVVWDFLSLFLHNYNSIFSSSPSIDHSPSTCPLRGLCT